MKTLKKIIIAIFIVPIFSLTVLGDEILDLYKHLHANPELSWQEYKTSDLLAEKMEELGRVIVNENQIFIKFYCQGDKKTDA